MRKAASQVSMKDIAEKLNLSPVTVSVVLNGRGDSVRISRKTQARIFEAAQEMGYQSTSYAKHGASETGRLPIAVFWRIDHMNGYFCDFLTQLYRALADRSLENRIMLFTYQPGRLNEQMLPLSAADYKGAMIEGTTENDQRYVENLHSAIPVVLIGRESQKVHCVSTNNYLAGELCAEMIGRRHTRAGMVLPQNGGKAFQLMDIGFRTACETNRIQIKPEWIYTAASDGFSEGETAILQLMGHKEDRPTVLLVMCVHMVEGMLHKCREMGISVPEDLEIIAIGDTERFAYLQPSVSAMQIPVGDYAVAALEMILLFIDKNIDLPVKKEQNPRFVFRASFPET